MTDVRTELRNLFRDIMSEELAKDPENIAMVRVPVSKFADAAADLIGALPAPPRYYPDEPQPSFSSMLSQEELANGRDFSSIGTHYDEDTGRVVIVSSLEGGKHGGWGLPLTADTAEMFFHQGLAVVRHAREQAGN